MMKLGVSLYPEQEKLEDIDAYLSMVSKYGFTKVFTSMFSVQGTKEEIVNYFKDFTAIAHKYGMVVSGDCNGEFFRTVGATETDLSVFVEMGIDIIRMDFSFNDERDAVLINNKDGIRIEMSTGNIKVINDAMSNGAEIGNISTCHNFYPQKYSAPSLDKINEINEYWKGRHVPVAIFISSRELGTHGPWPVSAGLPTLEEHRSLPLEVQLKHCLALKNVDEVLIGNAYASEAEIAACADVMKAAYVNVPLDTNLGFLSEYLPHGDLVRIPFNIQLEHGISDTEREILLQYPTHCDLGDCLNYFLRSRWPRMIYKGKKIPVRGCDKTHYTRGDVVIVNDNLAHYRGEVQLVLKDMEVDGQRNLLGRIAEEELVLLNHMGAGDIFTFVEKEAQQNV